MIYLQRTQVFRLPFSPSFFLGSFFFTKKKGMIKLKKFQEKYKDLLKSEGFYISVQSKDKTNYNREDGIFISVTKKDDEYVTVTSILPKDKIIYTTTISQADPTGIFERLIRRFHDQDIYQHN